MDLGSNQPLTEMSTRNISCEIKAASSYHLPVQIVWIVGASTSWYPRVLYRD